MCKALFYRLAHGPANVKDAFFMYSSAVGTYLFIFQSTSVIIDLSWSSHCRDHSTFQYLELSSKQTIAKRLRMELTISTRFPDIAVLQLRSLCPKLINWIVDSRKYHFYLFRVVFNFVMVISLVKIRKNRKSF